MGFIPSDHLHDVIHRLANEPSLMSLDVNRLPESHHVATQICMLCVQDTDDMDYLLPQSITELGNCLMQLAATLIFVSIVQPIFLAGGAPCLSPSSPLLQTLLDLHCSAPLALLTLRLPNEWLHVLARSPDAACTASPLHATLFALRLQQVCIMREANAHAVRGPRWLITLKPHLDTCCLQRRLGHSVA